MHIRKSRLAVALATILSLVGTSHAGVLTVYYNQADWEAATAGLEIGPYTGVADETDFLTTISTHDAGDPTCPPLGPPVCVIGTSVVTFPDVGFSSFHKNFTFPQTCIELHSPD